MKTKGIIAIDLDGTLLDNNSKLSYINRVALERSKNDNYIVIIATGRSLFSAKKVMPKDIPIDYLVFSSGAGVLNWKTNKIIHKEFINKERTIQIIDILKMNELNFMIHHDIPKNHHFSYYNGNSKNSDFLTRKKIYSDFATSLHDNHWNQDSCQFVVLFNNLNSFEKAKQYFPDMNIVRTTSPLDGKTIWMEIFPNEVSKASGIKIIAKKYNISINNIYVVGNDYNDLDMLEYSNNSFVVANAPTELLDRYHTVSSNINNGVAEVINLIFSEKDTLR